MVIKIDVDGVLRDIVPTLVEIYNSQYNGNMSVDDVTEYNVNTSFPNIIKQDGKLAQDVFFVDNCIKVFLGSEPFNGAVNAMGMLKRAGHKIIICTHQPDFRSKLATLMFLKNNSIPYDDICFTRDKYLIKSDVIVDDNPDFLEKDESPIKICINAPYNKEYNGEGVEKYGSFYEFVTRFLKV